jgi:hypothetical protein
MVLPIRMWFYGKWWWTKKAVHLPL